MLDFSKCRREPFAHQKEDVEWLMERPYAFIASEMRTGKTKIVIDAAQFLFEQGAVDRVVVVAPAPVRDVWFDPDFGEIHKHGWLTIPHEVIEFHAKTRMWRMGRQPEPRDRRLQWIVTNYEFLRARARMLQLLELCNHRTLLVGDESSYLKNHSSQQTEAFVTVRHGSGRVVLLNGTPIFHSPKDLFSQANILHPTILCCEYITQFMARYAIQKPVLGVGGKPLDNGYGKPVLTVESWHNLEDIERRLAPYTRRRLQKDCLDLPPKLDPVTLTARLEPETWRHYKTMRDQLVVWLKQGRVVNSATAAIKVLRLAQMTGGFLSGAEDSRIETEEIDLGLLESLDLPDYGDAIMTPEPRDLLIPSEDPMNLEAGADGTVEVGREKLDVLLWFIEQRLEADPNLHLVAWHRFRAELLRTIEEVQRRFPQFETATIIGGQKRADRRRALSLLHPDTSPIGPVFIAGIEGTGSFGLNMTASHTCVTMSGGYSHGRTAQTLDRVYGPGQTQPIAYYNVIAVGPNGQKTIDHDIYASRLLGEDIALRTAAAWVKAVAA